jgi:hypothetical protein
MINFGKTLQVGNITYDIPAVAFMCPFWEFHGHNIVYPFLRYKRMVNWWSNSIDRDFTHE